MKYLFTRNSLQLGNQSGNQKMLERFAIFKKYVSYQNYKFITTALHTFLKHLEKVRKNLSRKKAKIRKIFFSYLTNILAKFSFFFSKLKFEKGSENNAKFRILIFFQTDQKLFRQKKRKFSRNDFPIAEMIYQFYKSINIYLVIDGIQQIEILCIHQYL